MNNLEQSIVKTIAFFDVFDFPLTTTEIWKWLYKPGQKFSYLEIMTALQTSPWLASKLSLREGFYCLQNREHIIQLRKAKNNLAEKKFTQAVRMVRLFQYIPFVKMVAVCNTLAYSNASEESDIDFFIITESGKIWLARFFTILLTRIFARRPSAGNHANAICLSFFIDERQLNIRPIMYSSNDIYTPYWIQQLMPIYDPQGLYSKFIKANSWYREYLPNGYKNKFVRQWSQSWPAKIFSRVLGFIASPPLMRHWTGPFYRRMQTGIISRNLKELVNIDTRIMVNDFMLKFHSTDRREEYFRSWKNRISNLQIGYESN